MNKIKKLKKEILVWKIIRDNKDKYYLVEASIPKGALVYQEKENIRCDRAKINYITELNTGDKFAMSCANHSLLGTRPPKIVVKPKWRKRVTHIRLSMWATKTKYTVGKTIYPNFFSSNIELCTHGLHFFTEKSINKVNIIWEKE